MLYETCFTAEEMELGGESFSVRLLDLSEGGAALFMSDEQEVGKQFGVELQMDDGAVIRPTPLASEQHLLRDSRAFLYVKLVKPVLMVNSKQLISQLVMRYRESQELSPVPSDCEFLPESDPE